AGGGGPAKGPPPARAAGPPSTLHPAGRSKAAALPDPAAPARFPDRSSPPPPAGSSPPAVHGPTSSSRPPASAGAPHPAALVRTLPHTPTERSPDAHRRNTAPPARGMAAGCPVPALPPPAAALPPRRWFLQSAPVRLGHG